MAIFPLISKHKAYLPIPYTKQSFGKVWCKLLLTGDTFTLNSQKKSFLSREVNICNADILFGLHPVAGQQASP